MTRTFMPKLAQNHLFGFKFRFHLGESLGCWALLSFKPTSMWSAWVSSLHKHSLILRGLQQNLLIWIDATNLRPAFFSTDQPYWIFCKYFATKSLNISEAEMNSMPLHRQKPDCPDGNWPPWPLERTPVWDRISLSLSGCCLLKLLWRRGRLDDHFLRITCSQNLIFPQHFLIQNPGPGMLENLLLSVILQPYAWPSS